jgi:signal transduction histidine kinase
MAWIGLIDPDSKMVNPAASYGDTDGYLDGIRIYAADVPEGRGPTGKAVFEGKCSISADIAHDPRMLPWREKAIRHGLHSSSAFPICAGTTVIGALTVYSGELEFFADEEIQLLTSLADDVSFAVDAMANEKKRLAAEEALTRINEELEQRIALRTADLQVANKELEAFNYSVSHDLRAPLRHMAGYTERLQKQLVDHPNEKTHQYMTSIIAASKRMDMLINDLLAFSHLGRQELQKKKVNLNALVSGMVREIREEQRARKIDWEIDELPDVPGDQSLLRLAIFNLISNAVKFTSTRSETRIRIKCKDDEDHFTCSIADNGVGFDMKYIDRLFGVFQRLHTRDEFEGTGIGLANVQRIISRHGGKVWAEGVVGQGATFYFTLPTTNE